MIERVLHPLEPVADAGSRVLLLGNRKFLALEVTVTRRRLPFSKRLENFVVRIWMGYTAPGCR